MRRITEFELVIHGVCRPDYFEGCGVTFTNFEQSTTGIGENLKDAVGNCLEMMIVSGYDIQDMEERILEQEGWTDFPTEPHIPENEEDRYYFVTIRWSGD